MRVCVCGNAGTAVRRSIVIFAGARTCFARVQGEFRASVGAVADMGLELRRFVVIGWS